MLYQENNLHFSCVVIKDKITLEEKKSPTRNQWLSVINTNGGSRIKSLPSK